MFSIILYAVLFYLLIPLLLLQLLRESGILKLPSSRTLRDYTHFASAKPGFSVEVDKMLIDASKVASCPEREKYVLLLLDEMHVKEDLIFNKHSGELIGFSNLGDINNHLEVYLRSLDTDIEQSPPLARSVMVFMVRGLFTKMQFAYAQFPCCSLTDDKLYAPFWNALSRIENCGLKVCILKYNYVVFILLYSGAMCQE